MDATEKVVVDIDHSDSSSKEKAKPQMDPVGMGPVGKSNPDTSKNILNYKMDRLSQVTSHRATDDTATFNGSEQKVIVDVDIEHVSNLQNSDPQVGQQEIKSQKRGHDDGGKMRKSSGENVQHFPMFFDRNLRIFIKRDDEQNGLGHHVTVQSQATSHGGSSASKVSGTRIQLFPS